MTTVGPIYPALAIVTCGLGIAASWLFATPFGLLCVAAVVFPHAGHRLLPLSVMVLLLALAGSLLPADWSDDPAGREWAYATFVALVLGLAGTFAARRPFSSLRASPSASGEGRQVAVRAAAPLGLLHPDDRPAATLASARAFWTGVPQVMRYRQLQPDGSYRWVRTRSAPGYEAGIDIPELETTREEATTPPGEGSDEDPVKAAKIVENLFGNGWAFDAEGRWIYLPLFAQTTLGLTPDNLNAACDDGHISWKRLLHPDEYEHVAGNWRASLTTGAPFHAEFRIRRANGVYAWARTAACPVRHADGHITGWYGTSIDIDVYRKTEEALRTKERQLRQLIDTVPAMMWSTLANGTPTYVNRRFNSVTGASLADITAVDGSPSLSVVHPEDRPAAVRAFMTSVETGVPYHARYRQQRADGGYRWTETRAEPLRDDAGVILQWYGVSVDIDEQVAAEAELRESVRAHLQLVETLPALIYCATPKGEPTYRSQKLRDFLGFGPESTDGSGRPSLENTLEIIIHPDELAIAKERYAHSLATGEPYHLKHRLRRADGVYRWVETRAAPMRNAEGVIIQWNGICLEIEDQVRAQEELRLAQETLARASQAASLAELSASIAHEVNQPLAAIVANSHSCLRWLSAEPPNLQRAVITAERIIRDANATADIVSRIRALFRQSVQPRTSTVVADAMSDAHRLLAEEAARRGIRVHVEAEGALPRVAFDRVQLQQVLVNLVRNGMEAMEGTDGEKLLTLSVRRTDDLVQVGVSDQGPGVAYPDRVFEPFFTTKSHGMGMGLAICRSIVESHGGRLWVEPNEPQGATFIFTLLVETEAT